MRPISKGQLAYAIGKVNDMVLKIEKALDDMDIASQQIDQAIQVLLLACDKEITDLSGRTS